MIVQEIYIQAKYIGKGHELLSRDKIYVLMVSSNLKGTIVYIAENEIVKNIYHCILYKKYKRFTKFLNEWEIINFGNKETTLQRFGMRINKHSYRYFRQCDTNKMIVFIRNFKINKILI